MDKMKANQKKQKSNSTETLNGWKADLLLSKNSKKRTWLHIAAQSGSSDIIADLLSRNGVAEIMEVDKVDKFGYTPAILACICQKDDDKMPSCLPATEKIDDSYRTSILKTLSKAGSDWDRRNYQGNYNPMHWAIFNKDISLAAHILVLNPNMRMAMFTAVIEGTGPEGVYPFELPFSLIKKEEERKRAMVVTEFALKCILEIMKIPQVP
jgi:ankyrin repeat protein